MEQYPDPMFSNREIEVLALLLQGKSNKEIAHTLGVSNRTIEAHLSSIYSKLAVTSRTEAVIKLTQMGWSSATDKTLPKEASKAPALDNRTAQVKDTLAKPLRFSAGKWAVMTLLTALGLIWIFTKQNWLLVPVLGFMAWIGLAEYLTATSVWKKWISLLIFILGFSLLCISPAWLISATPLAKDNAVLDLLQKIFHATSGQ
ncbi:response regulator transcription factor [Thermanaerothrix sp. 4228-RoL]|uniref:Response regulator transcription factor n=1 Tax=Thermanaerothrix solaris TaxID=3058434 RepID=A0ABU3NSL1_9CHLR|nr:response regulator transcription factor [Thermanaerothrix sp. 4228-RoL]MDT8898836.1 response regulator transcription factor [Thermanaerothrix sp. 4228-RoL]